MGGNTTMSMFVPSGGATSITLIWSDPLARGHSSQLPYMGSARIADIKYCEDPPLSPAFLDWRGTFGAAPLGDTRL